MTILNKSLVEYLTETNRINGVSFVSIKGYTNSHGEVANHLVNIGASLDNAKAKDLKDLKELDIEKFYMNNAPKNDKMTLELFKKAYINVYNSLVPIGGKLYEGTVKVQNERSKAQINAYTVINSSVKVHNEFEQLYMFGLKVRKEILIKGIYPVVNSRPLTIAQNIIKKGMKHTKFGMYIVEKADILNMAKTQFIGEELRIDIS